MTALSSATTVGGMMPSIQQYQAQTDCTAGPASTCRITGTRALCAGDEGAVEIGPVVAG